MRARRIFLGLGFVLVIALPTAEGCGGDDAAVNGDNSDSGGGGDGTTTGSDGSTTSDGNTNSDTGTTPDAFCTAENDYVTRCSLTDACSLAVAAACSSTEANASPQFIGAYEACESMQPCPSAGAGDGGAAAYDNCLRTHFGAPDAVAEQLASDFCAKCLPAVGECSVGFYGNPTAARLLELDDAILTEIDDTCTKRDGGAGDGGFASCTDAFTACARDIVLSHDPIPAACNDR